MMNEQVKTFIEQNIDLIQQDEWEEIYAKSFPDGFTETLLDCGINPLEQGLDYVPDRFLYKSSIKELMISNTITEICEDAFNSCDNLKHILFGEKS